MDLSGSLVGGVAWDDLVEQQLESSSRSLSPPPTTELLQSYLQPKQHHHDGDGNGAGDGDGNGFSSLVQDKLRLVKSRANRINNVRTKAEPTSSSSMKYDLKTGLDESDARNPSPFSWLQRRLNQDNDLDEFMKLEHEIAPTTMHRPSEDVHDGDDGDDGDGDIGHFDDGVGDGNDEENEDLSNVVQSLDLERVQRQQQRRHEEQMRQLQHQRSRHIAQTQGDISSQSMSRSNHRSSSSPHAPISSFGDGDGDGNHPHLQAMPVAEPSALVRRFFGQTSAPSSRPKSTTHTKPNTSSGDDDNTNTSATSCSSCKDLHNVRVELKGSKAEVTALKARLAAATTTTNGLRKKNADLERSVRDMKQQVSGMGMDVQRERKIIEDERKRHVKQMRKQRLELDQHLKSVLQAHLPDRGVRQQLEQNERLLQETKRKGDAALSKAKAEIQRLKKEVSRWAYRH